MGLGVVTASEAAIRRGWNAELAAEVLGEALRSLEPGRCAGGSETGDPFRLKFVDDPRHQGRLRTDDHKINGFLFA